MRSLPLLTALLAGCATYDTNLGTKQAEDTAPVGGDDCTESLWYADADGDGYGSTTELSSCDPPAATGWTPTPGDCDDADAAVSPAGTEVCNDVDDDCDGVVDDGAEDMGTWYADADGDGFGDESSPVSACAQPSGAVDDRTDCDDADGAVNPDATEVCNDVDDDCNGEVDDGAIDPDTWYADSDADGHGDPASSTQACDAPSGYVGVDDDCDDADAGRWDTCDDPTSHGGICHGGSPSTYDSGVSTTPELHIVGVYEPDPRGTSITVDVDRAADVKLVLSSYEPTTWIINASSRTNLTDVVVNGYNASTVTGAGSATVTYRTTPGSYWSACAYGWPSTTGGCDTPSLVAAAEAWAGVATRGFVGCYKSSAFTVH